MPSPAIPHASSCLPGARRAFTLVELLVVLLIIALLVGLLVPALSSARNAAKKAASIQTMQGVLSACATFKTDHPQQDVPGPFSVEQLASNENNGASSVGWGLSQMQNAVLDLAGGIVAKGPSAPAEDSTPGSHQRRIQMRNANGSYTTVLVDPSKVGSPDGPQYLALPKEIRGLVEGKRNKGRHYNSTDPTNNDNLNYFPDVIDAFGYPILMWAQNPSAGPNPSFTGYTSPNPGDTTTQRSRFYWTTNASYLAAHTLGPLGRAEDTQTCLGQKSGASAGFGAGSVSEADRVASLEALLGNQADHIIVTSPSAVGHRAGAAAAGFAPAVNSPLLRRDTYGLGGTSSVHPGSAKGDIVMHSAGPDGYYLFRDGGKITQAAYWSFNDLNGNDKYDGPAEALPKNVKHIGNFDDFTVPE